MRYAEDMKSLFSRLSVWSPQPKIASRRGFTLLELLVVIAILGILMAMGAVAFSTAQRQGRDAKRRADMKALQGAFEQYYAENNSSYGANCAAMAVSPYIPSGMPVDPQSPNLDYTCTLNVNLTSYCSCAELENVGTGNANSAGAAGVCSFATGGNFYCVTNLQ